MSAAMPAVDAKVRIFPDGQSMDVFALTGDRRRRVVERQNVGRQSREPETAVLGVTVVVVLLVSTVVSVAIFVPLHGHAQR